MTSSLRGKCDWPTTQSGLHPATLDVNKICSCIFFLPAQLVLRMQKRGATGSVLLHDTHTCSNKKKTHTHTTLPWAQMESSEGTQSVKCSAGEHLGFFWPETSSIIYRCPFLTVLWWKWRCRSSFVRGELKVRGPDAWRSISRHLTFLGCNFLPRGFYFLKCVQHKAEMIRQTERLCFFSPSLLLPRHCRFIAS